MSKLSKKTQETLEKGKSAAVDLQGAAESVRAQAAQATSAAAELARGTAAEFLNLGGAAQQAQQDNRSSQQQQPEQEQQAGAGPSAGADEEPRQRPALAARARGFLVAAWREMAAAVRPEEPAASALRGAAKASNIVTSEASDLVAAREPEPAAWQKQWNEMRDKLGGHPIFRRVSGLAGASVSPALARGRDVAEGLRERWETSDSPLVHRIQDATDSLFTENEAAAALREIRARDPAFDMVAFLRNVRADVPMLLKAYLEGGEEVIKEHCSPEMVERLMGIIKHQRAMGLVPDTTLLDVGDVELVDLKVLEEQPVVVLQFTAQQINCTRDGHGNVVDGAADDVHRVYYYWALQQEAQGYVGVDGRHHPPRWQLREMLVRGMHHLL